MKEFIVITTVYIGFWVLLSIPSLIPDQNIKKFTASCEFNGGVIITDSYGTLHCVLKNKPNCPNNTSMKPWF
jgi:hypothetical protein